MKTFSLLPSTEPKQFSDEELDGFDLLPQSWKTFAIEYLKHRRPIRAAKIAGFKDPKKMAKRLLHNEKVRRYMEYEQERMKELARIDREYIVLKLKEIAEKGSKTSDRLQALNLLARIEGLLQDKAAQQPPVLLFNFQGLKVESED